MSQSILVLEALVPVFVAIGVGALLRKRGILNAEIEKGMMQTVVVVLFPALTLAHIIGNESLDDVKEVAQVAGFGFVSLLVSLPIAYFCAGLFGMSRGNGKRTFGVCNGIQNYGYMGIPLLLTMFPDRGLLGVLFTHNVGVELAMWTVGVALMRGDKHFSWNLVLKPPVLAVLVGLLINFTGIDSWFEGTPMKSLKMLGAPAIPIALIVIGAGLVELLQKERFSLRVAMGSIVVRLLLLPSLMIAAAYFLPISTQLKQVVVIQAAMPAAMFPIVLAKHYGGKPEVAVQAVVATTVACFITMPLVITFGVQILGL